MKTRTMTIIYTVVTLEIAMMTMKLTSHYVDNNDDSNIEWGHVLYYLCIGFILGLVLVWASISRYTYSLIYFQLLVDVERWRWA